MFPLRDRAPNRRNARLDARDARAGARHVLFLAETRIAANLGETKRLALIRQAALRYRQLLLQSAQLEIVARDLRRDADPHVVDVGFETVSRSRGRPNLRPDAAEDVDLPERVEAEAIRRHPDGFAGEARNLFVAVVNRGTSCDHWIPIVPDVCEDRARLIEPSDGDSHVVIGLQRPTDELVENGVFELLPPARIEGLLRDRRVQVVQDDWRHRWRDV